MDNRFMTISEACDYLRMGRNNAWKFLYSINAVHKISTRKVLIDRKVVDEYFDKAQEDQKDGN